MKPWQKEFFKISQVYLGNLGMYLSHSKKKKIANLPLLSDLLQR